MRQNPAEADDASGPLSSADYRLDRLRVRHVRLLEIIQRKGSLGGAARELGLSQPAVTVLLRELEEVFGAALVTRSARGATLTAAGRGAMDRLTVALASLKNALDAAGSAHPEPVIRLGCVQVASFSALPLALAGLEAAREELRLHIEEGEALTLLTSLSLGELDCVVGWLDEAVAAAVDLAQLDVQPLWVGRMHVIAAANHPLVKRRELPVSELAAQQWIVHREGSRTHAAFQRLFLQNGCAAPAPMVQSSSIHTSIHLVAKTRMLGIAPDRLVMQYETARLVKRLKGDALDLGRTQLCFFSLRQNAALSGVSRLRRAFKSLDF